MIKKELYKFTHGTTVWHFTSSNKKVLHDGIEYLPFRGLSRSDIEDIDLDKNELDLTFPQVKNNFTAIFENKIYFESVYLTITELRGTDALVLFKGRVTQPKFDESAHTMTLACSTAETYQKRNILTRKFQRNCSNKIYDSYCGLRVEDFSVSATIVAMNGLSIEFETTQEFKVGRFARGLLIRNGIETYIQDHTGNTILLYRQHMGLAVGDTVVLAMGCDQSMTVCHEDFDNHLNYQGFPNMPNENPVNKQILK